MYRVLMVTERYVPIWGGAENQLRQLIPHLMRKGHEVSVATRRWHRKMPSRERVDQVMVYRLGIPGTHPFATLIFILHLLFFFVANHRRYDLFHSHGVIKIGVLCRVGALISGAKNVAKIATAGKVLPLKNTFYGRLLLQIFKRSDVVIGMTGEIRRELKKIGVRGDQVAPIPNAVDCDRFKREERESNRRAFRRQLGLPENALLVLFTGRLVYRKGLDVLVGAWEKVCEKHPELYLLVLGSGDDQVDSVEDKVKRIKDERKLDSLLFLGVSEIPEMYLANSDIFVFPSRKEGFPNSLMEAMASELPVIASRIGGNIDLVENRGTGILFEKDDVVGLANCIGELVSNRNMMRQLGYAARCSMVSSYDFPSVAQQYCNLYRRIHG